MTDPFTLEGHGITVAEIHRNLPPSALYEHAIRYEKDASIAENGALVAYSGAKTGRSPKDKRIVKHPILCLYDLRRSGWRNLAGPTSSFSTPAPSRPTA